MDCQKIPWSKLFFFPKNWIENCLDEIGNYQVMVESFCIMDLLAGRKNKRKKVFFCFINLMFHRFHWEYYFWEFVLPLFIFSLDFFWDCCTFRHRLRFWKSVCFELVIRIVLVKDPKPFISLFYSLVSAETVSFRRLLHFHESKHYPY